MVSQKYANQVFLHVILFPIVAPHHAILKKCIGNILKACNKDEDNNAKSSTTFCSYIRNIAIKDDEIMVSFDVTSLYTNIPITDTLSIIKYYFNSDYLFIRKTPIAQNKFLDLVYLVLTTTCYTFNSQFYKEADGVTTGAPASSTTAEIYLQAHEETAIYYTAPSKSLGTTC